MSLIKEKEVYIHSETGMKAEITNDGKVTIYPNHGSPHKGFVFINSKKETIAKVCGAILEFAAKARATRKLPKSQQF